MNETCGCCQGVEQVTPLPTQNRPGLSAIAYRVGTHSTFLETMTARLSTLSWESPGQNGDGSNQNKIYPLLGLKTRLASDPAIAFLDAWATVADVLTFYQERIANEGYLRTATERQSVLELGRLVGYQLRPGVAASVYLAYTIENNQTVEIMPGNRVQSLPGPGEMPQSFETSDKLVAQSGWNNLTPRLTQPQQLLNLASKTLNTDTLYLQGTATNLKPNDPLLFVTGEEANQQVFLQRVESVELQPAANRTRVKLQNIQPPQTAAASTSRGASETPNISDLDKRTNALLKLDNLVAPLTKPPSQQPANALRLQRDIAQTFAFEADTAPRLLTALEPTLGSTLYNAWQNLVVQPEQPVKVYALRARASVFGHNALKRAVIDGEQQQPPQEWTFDNTTSTTSPQPFQLVIALTPGTASPGPEATVTVPNWIMSVGLSLGTQNGSPNNFLISSQGQSFSIQGEQPTVELARVTVSNVSGNALLPLTLQFDFPNRSVGVQISIDANQQLDISSTGSDPTQIVIGSTSTQPSAPTSSPGILFDASTSTFNNGLTITVNGTLRQATGYTEVGNVIWLDTTYDQILPESWIVIERPNALNIERPNALNSTIPKEVITQVNAVSDRSRNEYDIAAKATRIELKDKWLEPSQDSFQIVRETAVFAQSEELTLAEAPITPADDDTKNPIVDKEIELGELYQGLEAGRWLIVSGERAADNDLLKGVKASELVMLAGVEQRADPTLTGDKPHTFLQLAQPLAYQYKRNTVTIYGNVVKATHGETRTEVLGSGDAKQELQSFTLQQFPVTYLAAPTPTGAVSTLEVRVNDILWHETDTLATLAPSDRNFITQTDDQGTTTVIFGNGRQGARPPSGIENIKAVYRKGIGKSGNVKAEQISLLATRPLGVKSTINPLPATGGADSESRDQARRNLPLALIALDRLVSVQDYADFARTFAGIGKASATRLSDGKRQLVHLTIAGADDSPIDVNSDLYHNFLQALQQLGDPNLPVRVEPRELLLLVINANIQILPDYLWESVATQIRTALLETFSFERRQLGQPAYLSEVIYSIQQVPGVAYVDVDTFDGIPEKDTDKGKRRVLPPSEIANRLQHLITDSRKDVVSVNLAGDEDGTIHPAQIAYLTPAVPDTLILNRIS